MTVLQFCEQAINVAISGILRQGELACWGCWLLTEGDPSNAFPLLGEGNAGWIFQAFRARSDQVLEVLLFLAFSRRAITACGVSHVPKMKRDLRWCRGTLLHQNETSRNFGKEDFGILIVIYSKYTINQVHCMRLHFFSTYYLWLKVVFVSFP